MGIQADFTDESDLESYSSEGDLVIADDSGDHDPKVQNIGCENSKSPIIKGEGSKTTRKAIELKYIYGDDLSKNDLERRKFWSCSAY